jgi:hypothetical protein
MDHDSQAHPATDIVMPGAPLAATLRAMCVIRAFLVGGGDRPRSLVHWFPAEFAFRLTAIMACYEALGGAAGALAGAGLGCSARA